MLIVFASVTSPSHALEIDDLDSYLYPKDVKTISMNFTGATLQNVLKIFAQQSGLNFIVTENIASTTVNLYLVDVPVDEALELILSSHNLTYEINPDSNIFVVKALQAPSQQLMTRIYPLKNATVPSSQLLNTLSSGGQGSSNIIEIVSATLSKVGSVVEDSRTNSLVINDIPSQFPLIESTITRLDIRIPQIMIEAEILDISKSTSDEMGVKFGDQDTEGVFSTITPASRNSAYPFNPDKLIDDGFFTKSYTAGRISFPALALTLEFLRSRTDTKNLARPRILTLNNSTAEISIETDQAIAFQQSTVASEGQAESVAEAERVKTGVSLKVTPQANIHTREITIAIEPKVSDVSVSNISDEVFDPEERSTRSIFRVHDGDTIVIGGLLRTEDSNAKTFIPILGEIPIIGAPFRRKNKTGSQRELIIFITPHILDENVPLKTTSSKKSQKIAREQSAPSGRAKEIKKELSHMEKKYFNAYK